MYFHAICLVFLNISFFFRDVGGYHGAFSQGVPSASPSLSQGFVLSHPKELGRRSALGSPVSFGIFRRKKHHLVV